MPDPKNIQIALDMRAAAAALCMSYSAFRRLYYAETKVLPAGTKIGGKVLFAVADLAAIFETPAAEPEPAQEQLKRGRGRPRKVAQPGGEARWHEACRATAEALNGFLTPLPDSEVRGIARGVARWTWRHTTPERFRALQSARGKRSGAARRAGSIAESAPWAALGISRATWYRRRLGDET